VKGMEHKRRKAEMRPAVWPTLGLTLALLAGPWLLSVSRAPVASTIEGRVTDEHGPLTGARVRLKGTGTWTTTDQHERGRPKPGTVRRLPHRSEAESAADRS
jgi:hypothetical protein